MTRMNKHLLRALGITLALALLLAGVLTAAPAANNAAVAETQETVSSYPYTTVTRDKVNLRAGTSTRTTLIGRIPAGAEITVHEVSGSWARVTYLKNSGWVYTEYIVLKTVKKVKATATPSPVPTLSPEEDAGGYTVLKKGMTGEAVECLQEALIELGYLTGKADGNFGDGTYKAVVALQKKNGYPDTGLVDANLQAFLYSGKPLNAKGVATKINTVSPVPGVTIKLNSTGHIVGELQQRLKDLGYYKATITNKYDTNTKTAVTAFQKKNGLKADGLAGATTRSLLDSAEALPADATPTPVVTPTPTPTPTPVWVIPKTEVKEGSEGADAKNVQTRLKDLGYYRGELDGKFGRASVNALKSFQANNGLKQDGKAGTNTYAKLYSADAVPFSIPETPTPTPTATPTPTPTPAPQQSIVWTTLRAGMSGTDVQQLQENLIQLGYLSGKADGVYGVKTVAAVRAFQKANGLTQDGTAGVNTLKALYSGTAKEAEKVTPTESSSDSKSGTNTNTAVTSSSLKQGSTGSQVTALQNKLISLGYLTGKADGVFGSKTTAAVKAFQKDNKLDADGVAGSKTLTKLNNATPTPAPTAKGATPTPKPASSTPVPGGTEALSGRPSAANVIYANWYTTVKDICRKYPYVTVYDYSTGISWQAHIFSIGAHADFEPVTANDTARMNRAFGGTTWNPKPVWVIFADGSVYMASTHNTPHGVNHTTDNNFDGHACIHFPRTQAQVEAIGPYATSHQETIDKGWLATRNMIGK